MRRIGLAVAVACLVSGSASVYAEGDGTYVPRSERDSDSVLTFKGSSKGLVIIDHETGEITRYTTKRQKALHRMTPEAEASARTAWEDRQEAMAEYEAEAAEQEEPEEAAESDEDDSEDSGAEQEAAQADSDDSDDED